MRNNFFRKNNMDTEPWESASKSQSMNDDRYYNSSKYNSGSQYDNYPNSNGGNYGGSQYDNYSNSNGGNYGGSQYDNYPNSNGGNYGGSQYDNYPNSNSGNYGGSQYDNYPNSNSGYYGGSQYGDYQNTGVGGCATNQYGNPAGDNYAGFGTVKGEDSLKEEYERMKRVETHNACPHAPSGYVTNYEKMVEDVEETEEYQKAKKVLFKANNGSILQMISSIIALIASALSFVLGQDDFMYGLVAACVGMIMGSKFKDKNGLSKAISIIALLLGLYGLYVNFPIKINYV